MRENTIYQILISYLNMAGNSLASGFIMTLGLSLIFPKQVFLNKRFVFGIALVIVSILILFRFMCRYIFGIIH